jgi:prepilin-type N-terminal cleavage/methylation domain-containing protein
MSIAGRTSRIREGFTLIELLMVVSILMLLTVIAAPTLGPAREGRRLREAARAVHAYFGSARALAMESGRNVGVALERQQTSAVQGSNLIAQATNSRACLTLYQVEQPPLYCGDVEGATVQVQKSSIKENYEYDINGNIIRYLVTFRPTREGTLDYSQLRVGDMVRFNNQGPWYRLIGPMMNNGTGAINVSEASNKGLTAVTQNNGVSPFPSETILSLPWPEASTKMFSPPVPYVFRRQPIRSTAEPLELPASTAIDLQFSGNDSYYADAAANSNSTSGGTMIRASGDAISFAPGWTTVLGTETRPGDALPVYIMFGPNGAVVEVYTTDVCETSTDTSYPSTWHQLVVNWPTEPLYLLVGDRARIKANSDTTTPSASPADDEFPNWYNANSLWLVLTPHSGMVRVVENFPVNVGNGYVVNGANMTFQWDDEGWASFSTSSFLSTSRWRRAILQSRSFARGSFFNDNGVLTSLGQGADDMGGR